MMLNKTLRKVLQKQIHENVDEPSFKINGETIK